MVKADPSQDYYADLELGPNCSTDEVKKQYRKLDRHPGHEAEYNSKFQAISAAHEVLIDPEQRTKYDLNRRRGNVNSNTFPRPPPPRRNAPTYGPPSNYPPPPRRTGPPRPDPGMPPSTRSGAERYTHFSSQPRTSKPSDNQKSGDRAADFKAWQKMNAAFHAQRPPKPANHQYNVPPPYQGERRDPADFPEEGPFGRTGRSSESSPPRSAYEELRQRPGLHPQGPSPRVPRKPGFDPADPSGDEGQAPAAKYRKSFSNRESPVPSPPNEPTAPPAPWGGGAGSSARQNETRGPTRKRSGEDVPFTEGEVRTSAPYASQRKERTYVSGDALRRSASTRDTPGLVHSPELTGRSGYFGSSERRRSASPAHPKVSGGGHSSGDTRSKQGRPGDFRPFVVYSSTEESEDSEPSAPKSGSRSRPSGESPVSSSSNLSSSSNKNATPQRPKAKPSTIWTNRRGKPYTNRSRSSEDEHGAVPSAGHGVKPSKPKRANTFSGSHFNDQDGLDSSVTPELPQTTPYEGDSALHFGPSTGVFHSQSNKVPDGSSHTYNGPKINSQVEEGLQNIHLTNEKAGTSRTQNDVNSHENGQAQSSNNSGWEERWKKGLQEENWASSWANPPSNSPSRPDLSHRGVRGRKPVPQPAVRPQPVSVEDGIEEKLDSFDAHSINNTDQVAVEEDPMEVDPPSLSKEESPTPVIVEDVEDKASSRQPVAESEKSDWQDSRINGSMAEVLPAPNLTPTSSLQRPSQGFTMNSFRHVAPFDTRGSGNGLQGMSDLNANLPFESKPSLQHPSRTMSGDNKTVEPEYVKPPRIPLEPQKLTKTSWGFHLNEMTTYLSKWNMWNARMISYFQDSAVRQMAMEEGQGMVKNWLSAVGETEELAGWDSYVAHMRKEETMRTRWNIACEKHLKAVEMHTKLRNQIQKGGILT